MSLLMAADSHAAAETLWSLSAPQRKTAPKTSDAEWSGSATDRWVKAAMEKQGLHPVAHAHPTGFVRSDRSSATMGGRRDF